VQHHISATVPHTWPEMLVEVAQKWRVSSRNVADNIPTSVQVGKVSIPHPSHYLQPCVSTRGTAVKPIERGTQLRVVRMTNGREGEAAQ
jgi:hypothetical protein